MGTVGTPEELLARMRRRVSEAREHITAITEGKTEGQELLHRYDDARALLSDGGELAKHVQQLHPSAAMRDAARAAAHELRAAELAVRLDADVFRALRTVETDDPVTRHYLDRTLRDLRRYGLAADQATRARVHDLQLRMLGLEQDFETAIRDDHREAAFPPPALAGLPADYLDARPPAEDGLVHLTMAYPDYLPVQRYCHDAGVRETMWRQFQQRGGPANATILRDLLTCRAELAGLLGYADYADLAASDKMIGTGAAIGTFLAEIEEATAAGAAADRERLLARKRADDPGATDLDPWDLTYLAEQVRAEDFGSDSRELRAYFAFDRVKAGIIDLLQTLFDVRFVAVPDVSVWHPDVETYDVSDAGGPIGRVHLDLHPRPDKYTHAAIFAMDSGKAGERLPECTLVGNFPQPGAAPALMLPSEVRTFLHEFGHVLHYLLAGRGEFAGLNGLSVEWDFVETPSQMLEEWLADAPTLAAFAVHHETGEPLPADEVDRMRAAAEFGRALDTRRQLFLATLSLGLHTSKLSPEQIEQAAAERMLPYPMPADVFSYVSFLHLSWYSALYYTYQWSLVIAKDLFTAFTTEGIRNPQVARRYRDRVLARGSSAPAADLVADFLGRPYNSAAYREWLS
ncbi:M3 family metallopeptidase [Actinoplanes sp. L3-i22]|uniref:M3 family metallopeptidase n=1 Tax=Actinoplanes sp. L3-i22 TaxID=2836373 RepID=UPI001C7564B3|nr:M3 family metallopeptidase [Actinoplanes sp. L3-i22]BCY09265.1 Zn-dependent oligopeptidase [Actinoplanes sp. L3-i22]